MIERLIEAARSIASDAPLHDRIAKSTGLSIEGVRFAIERCLETDPSEEEIATLVKNAPRFEKAYVLLSSTVFTAALRAIAVARAGSPSVVVHPSRRAPDFAEALVRAAGDPEITVARDLDIAEIDRGAIHVHGRMETIERIRAAAKVPVLAHGPGMGIAILGADADIDVPSAARDLADDVVPFDQRGCLSPRIAFVLGGKKERAEAFATALANALDRHPVPLGALTEEERVEAARFIQTVSFAGAVKKGTGGVVGLSDTPVLPPTGRHVHVVYARDEARLDAFAPHVTTVGIAGTVDLGIAPEHARVARFGSMQRPPFDGPVDRRTP